MTSAAQNMETEFAFRPQSEARGALRTEIQSVALQGRTPRVSKMVALAIHLQGLVDAGEVKDYTTMAKAGHVSRARITQIMDFTLLAPDIQEEILFLPNIREGRDKLNERMLRRVASEPSWEVQRQEWSDLRTSLEIGISR